MPNLACQDTSSIQTARYFGSLCLLHNFAAFLSTQVQGMYYLGPMGCTRRVLAVCSTGTGRRAHRSTWVARGVGTKVGRRQKRVRGKLDPMVIQFPLVDIGPRPAPFQMEGGKETQRRVPEMRGSVKCHQLLLLLPCLVFGTQAARLQ